MFIQSTNGPLYAQPFISKTFSAEVGSDPQRLDSYWSNYRTIRNPTLFALGVLLIELCLGKPLEELKLPTELNADGSTSPLFDWTTADRLVEDVYLEGGSRYGDAVRHCVRCDFDRRGASLEDEDFRQ
jgi:hypothetical protein